MNCKLIAFDLDGTLLDTAKNAPQENIDALCAAAEQGVMLVPATGRIYTGIPDAIKNLPFIRYYITVNGAYVYDAKEDTTLYSAEIPLELALRAYDYMDTLPIIYDCYQDNWGWIGKSFFEKADQYIPDKGILALMHKLRTPLDDFKGTLRERNRPLQKLQMFFKDIDLRDQQLEILPTLFPELAATTSVSNNIELNSSLATKGRALSALCEHLGLDISATAAIGDGLNDIDMLKTTGLSYAMANSPAAVKAAAERLAPSNDDFGAATAIYEILNNK